MGGWVGGWGNCEAWREAGFGRAAGTPFPPLRPTTAAPAPPPPAPPRGSTHSNWESEKEGRTPEGTVLTKPQAPAPVVARVKLPSSATDSDFSLSTDEPRHWVVAAEGVGWGTEQGGREMGRAWGGARAQGQQLRCGPMREGGHIPAHAPSPRSLSKSRLTWPAGGGGGGLAALGSGGTAWGASAAGEAHGVRATSAPHRPPSLERPPSPPPEKKTMLSNAHAWCRSWCSCRRRPGSWRPLSKS